MKVLNCSKKIISTIACVMLYSGIVGAQSYRFKHYSIENNLPDNVVYTLNQDRNGYLWIGTPGGLSRFDGFQFHRVL